MLETLHCSLCSVVEYAIDATLIACIIGTAWHLVRKHSAAIPWRPTLGTRQAAAEARWESIAATSKPANLAVDMIPYDLTRGAYESYEDALRRLSLRQKEARQGACQVVSAATGIDPKAIASWADGTGVHVRIRRAIENTEEVEEIARSAAGAPVRIHDTERQIPLLEPGDIVQLRRPT